MPPAGYFIDANLLVLLVAGNENRDLIGRHRALRRFTADDYDLLRVEAAGIGRLFVTPNTLTEASNLLGLHSDPERSRLFARLKLLIDAGDEVIVRSADASANSEYTRLGLTDAALLEVVTADTPLLTVDMDLYLAALQKDPYAALNFDHLRDF